MSELTAKESEQLLEKSPSIVTPNGFESGFIPQGKEYDKARKMARETLKNVAENLIGQKVSDDALLIGTSGRYEFRNKGIDIFLDSLKKLSENPDYHRETIVFILVPGWNIGPRKDLQQRMSERNPIYTLFRRNITHDIYNVADDQLYNTIQSYSFTNEEKKTIKVILVPSYLNGDDGIFNKSYYELLIGLDMTVFASYYEPWGYTPLESAAFGIPTITTNLAGFGLWVSDSQVDITNGVAVVNRNDHNYYEASLAIKDEMEKFAAMNAKEVEKTRAKAKKIADGCSWTKFVKYYEEAFKIALQEKKKNTKIKN